MSSTSINSRRSWTEKLYWGIEWAALERQKFPSLFALVLGETGSPNFHFSSRSFVQKLLTLSLIRTTERKRKQK